jgi:hypothetical protein
MGEKAGRNEVSVDPPYSASTKAPLMNKGENLIMRGGNDMREQVEIAQHTRAIFQISARKFAYDEGVCQHDALLEKFSQRGGAFAEMCDPDGSVG